MLLNTVWPRTALALGDGSGFRPIGKAHQQLELHPVRQDVHRILECLIFPSSLAMRVTSFGSGLAWPLAVWIFLGRDREQFVADAHLNAVRLTGEHRD